MTQAQTLPAVLLKAPEWSPVAAIKREAAEYYAQLFIARFPSWAARCGDRIARAVQICATPGACRRTEEPAVFHVQSSSNPRGAYRVDMLEKTCTCPDDGKNRHGPQVICKHRLAIAFHVYGPEWTREELTSSLASKAQALFAARKAADEAWQLVTMAADHYESLAHLDYHDPVVVAARERMLAANTQAAQLQAEYYSLAE